MFKIELLAPAGNYDIAIRTLNSEATAIYLGGKNFGARSYADNFTNEEIKNIISYAHLRDKKVYVTVNTLIFDNEINDVLEFIDYLYINKVDAVIVQDIGLASIINKRYNDLPLHASTQLNVMNYEEALTLKSIGFTRIILAREINLEEIKKINEKVDIELEVFIHGALCMCYSGNCYFSSFAGGRSGNRGRCAQPCRMLYRFNNKEKYFLSTKDLCTIEYLEDIIKSGVCSLKIEGRMKRPSYVSQVVKSYNNRINNINFNYKKEFYDLKLIYNREFTKGFILNESNKDITNIESSNHIGVLIGNVISSNNNYVTIRLIHELRNGDSIRICNTDSSDAITINQMNLHGKLVKEAKIDDVITVMAHQKNSINSKVYLTSCKKQINDLEKFEKVKINIDFYAYVENNYLCLEAKYKNILIKEKSNIEVELSDKDLSNRLKEQLIKTNDSPFKVNNINVNFKGFYLTIKEINDLRRRTLQILEEKIIASYYPNRIINYDYSFNYTCEKRSESKLKVIVEKEKQLLIVKDYDVSVYVANYNLYIKYKDVININYYAPRTKTTSIDSSMTSKIGVNNYAGSPYMNVVNCFTVNELIHLGFKSVCLSIELNSKQINDLLFKYKKMFNILPNIDIMMYGYYELMLMKHCFVNKEMKKEHNKCGECLNKFLENTKGIKYPLSKDDLCNLKILNNKPLNLYDYYIKLEDQGINGFILYFSIEDEVKTKVVMDMYTKKTKIEIGECTSGHFLGNGVI